MIFIFRYAVNIIDMQYDSFTFAHQKSALFEFILLIKALDAT